MATDETERDFLADYDPRAHAPVAVTVDVVALTIRHDTPHVLLIRRGEPPYLDHWALPGGFVRPDENLAQAALRELSEETRLTPELHLEQLGSYGDPHRDPRMRVVSVAHMVLAADLPDPTAGTDAADARWIPLTRLGFGDEPARLPLAFDHARILADGVDRARSKLEYTALATAFLPAEFTVAGLRGVYEAVWGQRLHPGNFQRKVLSVPGFVVDTGRLTTSGGDRGGRRARLYRAGDAVTLHPALLRPDTTRPEAAR